MIKERKEENESSLDSSSNKSQMLYDDTEEDMGTGESRRKNTHSSYKKSFQPANFGEYIEHKINQFFDSSSVTTSANFKGKSPGLKK